MPLWTYLRSSLWFTPGLMVAAAIALAAGLIEVDTRIERELLTEWPRLFGAGADGSRGMLTAIASSMITVAGVTFSITIVALSLASTQYTPRILRNFMSDRTNQLVLGFFVGIFTYCLIVLRTIRGGDEGSFIPSLAVAFGFVLALVGVGVLILFIHHIATSIQASQVISSVARETARSVERLFPEDLGVDAEEDVTHAPFGWDEAGSEWEAVPALKTGYIQDVDAEALLRLARERGVVVRMERRIGEFITKGSPLVSLAARDALDEGAHKELNGVFTVNHNRTVEQDAAFGIQQLVDIALKALSPGINDTTTAVMCVDYLSSILSILAQKRIESRYRTDGGELRVIAMGLTFAGLVAASFDQVRQNAEGNVAVLNRMLGAIERLAGRTGSASRRRVLARHARLVSETAERSVKAEYDRAHLRDSFRRALASLGEETDRARINLRPAGRRASMNLLFFRQTPQPTPVGEFDPGVVWRTITSLGESFLSRLPYIVIGIIVFFIFLIVARFVKRALVAAGERTRLDLTLADLLGRLASAVTTVIGLFVAAVIIFPTFLPGDLIAGLGITSVAIGFAFKDVLQNFFAGVLILWRRPFVVGDQISALGYEGTVEEINVRSTRLKTYDGERAVLPNGDVYTNAILVRTAYDRRRVRFTVGVGYPDSIEEARATIHCVLSETQGVLKEPEPWVYVAELAPSSVNFNVYFWVESPQANVLAVSDRVATGIKQALDDAGIDMPFPHTVILFHDATGTRAGDIERADYLTQLRNADPSSSRQRRRDGAADERKGE